MQRDRSLCESLQLPARSERRPLMARPWEGRHTRWRLPTVLAALATASLYAISFFLPVLDVLNAPLLGWNAYWIVAQRPWEKDPLTTGELLQLILWWLPNPLLWVGIVFLAIGRAGNAACLGLLAMAAGLSCAFDVEMLRFQFYEFRIGYYCWLASMAVLTAAGTLLVLRREAALTGS